jgi:transposase
LVMPNDALPDDPATLKAMLLAERVQNERLRQIIKELQRHRFGRRAETLPEDQMLLGLEDVEQAEANRAAQTDGSSPADRQARAHKRRINRGALPTLLPRIEVVVDIDDKTCPCCQGELHRIGEDKSERLDIVPARLRVLVTRRPKYACRTCEDGVVQAPAPARLIEGGLPTEATVAQVLVSKYADHLPLYRQAQIYARQGIDLDRSTLADWVGHAAWHLRPLHERLLMRLRELPRLFADETTAPVLDPGRGRTKTGQLWAYAADDRPWGGSDPPGVAYVYAPDRKAERPKASRASCKSMAMPATASWPSAATSGLRSAGRMSGVTSTSSPPPVHRRSPAKCSNMSPCSTPSRRTSVAAAPTNVAPSGSRKVGRSSIPLNPGCGQNLV